MSFVNRSFLRDNDILTPPRDELSDDLVDRIDGLEIGEDHLREQLQDSKRRDEMITLVFDFFLSEDNRPDDWNIAGTTVDIDGGDESIDIVLVGSSSSSGLLICNAREDLFQHRLETLRRLWQTACENTRQLERAVAGSGRRSLDANRILPIIGLHSTVAESAAESIESHTDGELDGDLLAWEFTLTENRIELVDDGFPNPTTMTRSHGLVSVSEDGVERGSSSEVSIDLCPTSGMLPKTVQAANHILKRRAEDSNDAPARYFTETMVLDFFDEQSAVTVNANRSSDSYASNLINWWMRRGLAETADSTRYNLDTGDLYRFNVNSEGVGNIINELENLCEEAIIEEKFRELALRDSETDTSDAN